MAIPNVFTFSSLLGFRNLDIHYPETSYLLICNFSFLPHSFLKRSFSPSGVWRLYRIKRGNLFLFGDFKKGQLKVDIEVSKILIYQMSHPQRSASTVQLLRELPTLNRKSARDSNKNCKESASTLILLVDTQVELNKCRGSQELPIRCQND